MLKDDGSVLRSEEAAAAHAGWNSLLLCELNGEYYLLRYNPSIFRGYCSYEYVLFTPEGGVFSSGSAAAPFYERFSRLDDMPGLYDEDGSLETRLEKHFDIVHSNRGQ